MKLRTVIVLSLLLSRATAAPDPAQWQTLIKTRPEADEIQWQDTARGTLKVRIVQATAQTLTVEKTLPAGITTREIPLAELSRIAFTLTPREAGWHRQPTAAAVSALRLYWETRRATIATPGSSAAQTGLALAKALRHSGSITDLEEADRVLDTLIARDPRKSRVEQAQAEKMTVEFTRLLQSDHAVETDRYAWKITEGPDNPDAMLLATAFLADRHFAELREIDRENPRWIDDDEIRPVRSRLYQLALDFSLYPSLFVGTREAEASAGLRRAAEIHHHCEEIPRMKGALEDLAALYPESAAAKETAAQLARLRRSEAGESTPVPASQDATEDPPPVPTAAPPPPAKRYNIFSD